MTDQRTAPPQAEKTRASRRRPSLAPGSLLADGAAATCLAGLAVVPSPGVGVALVVLVVALAVGTGPGGLRRGAMTLVAVVVLQTAAVAVALSGGPELLPLDELPFALTRALAPWLLAVAWTQHGQIRRSARLLAEQQEQESRASVERAQQERRLALAEGLHDDLGHALSLVALNLAGLEVRRDLDPEVAAQVRTAREQLGTAVERLGASVSSLRAGGEHRASPVSTVETLLDDARRSGMSVVVDGDGLESGAGGALAVRVLQEALTNAAKHAPGSAVRVSAATGRDHLCLTIATRRAEKDWRLSASHGGTGLLALSREAARHGGAVSWDDDQATDDFVVRARLPRHPPPAAPAASAEDQLAPVFEIATAAYRKGAAVLLSAAVLVVLALATVELTTRGLA